MSLPSPGTSGQQSQPIGPPKLVRVALWDEIRQGRVESDGNGRVRLRAGALPEDVIAALALFVD